MSWTFPPNHVVQDVDVSGSTNNTDTLPVSATFIVCSSVHCATNGAWSGSLPLLIAGALATIPDSYDWYTIAVHVDFPAVARGSDSCQLPPLAVCAKDQDSFSEGTLNFDLVRMSDGTPYTNTGGTTSPFGTGGPAPAWQLGDVTATSAQALIVNPAPLFPVPDPDGDTAGQVLWTRAQLLAADGALGIDWDGEWISGTSNLGVQVVVSAYADTSPVTPGTSQVLL